MSELDPDYASAVAAHVAEQTEDSLSHAYDLGRRALGEGLGILELLSLYDAAYKNLVLPAAPGEREHVAAAVGGFFRELASVFEMSFRGYREANDELKRLNDDLKAAYGELQTKQMQLIQSAKMASLGELVAGIAHEINNPLAFVGSHVHTALSSVRKAQAELGPLASLETTAQLERASNRLQESELGAERIRDLVLKLRTFSRLDEGERRPVSIRECVASVLTILRHRFIDRIQLHTRFGDPDMVDCFPGLLNQAIMNLVANAIDAIADTGTIWISTAADGDCYVIAVADTGHGISDSVHPRVLEPFFTTKPVGQGTGLGLSITYSIAQTHGGTLELTPRDGGGTVATIRFPLNERSR
jgi:two-component system NtrC family sensor kinase